MSEADSAGALGTLFFYVLFVHPVCAWILAPKRFKKDRAIVYAILFLAAIAIGKAQLESHERGKNYYQVLGVRRSSTPAEIKRAYRTLSLELHPDKNPSPGAADRFAKLSEALEVLMDAEKREIYDKLGPEAALSKRPVDENTMLLEMAVWYLTWGVLAYVMTLGKSNLQSRDWIYTGQIVMLVAEISILTSTGSGGSVLPSWLFPSMAEHELVWYLHAFFPAFMNGCRSIGSHIYVDVDKQTRDMLLALKESHKDMSLQLRDVLVNMNSLGGANGGRMTQSASSGSVVGGGGVKARVTTPVARLRELEERSKCESTGVDAVAAEIQDSGKPGGNMQWIFVGMWVLFYFFLNQNGS